MTQTPDARPVNQTTPAPAATTPAAADLFSATQAYQALQAQRDELRNQLSRLEDQRSEIAGPLRGDRNVLGADRQGSESRLRDLDARIANVERQLAEADMAVARAAAVPGAVQREDPSTGPKEEPFEVAIVFTIFVLCPIAIAYARRIWKRGAMDVAPVSREVQERLDRMSQAIEAIAIETERIGEGQRFLTRVMTDQSRALGAGPIQAMPPVQAEQKVTVPEYRP